MACYDPVKDVFTSPHDRELCHTTTNREGKRVCRSTLKHCVNCPSKACYRANEKGQTLLTPLIWQEYLDIVGGIRKTELGKKKPLNGFSWMQKRNSQCVTHTTEA